MQTEVPADDISAVLPLFEDAMQNSTYFYLGLNYKNGEDEITRKLTESMSRHAAIFTLPQEFHSVLLHHSVCLLTEATNL